MVTTGFSFPKTNSMAALWKDFIPIIPAYSLSNFLSSNAFSTFNEWIDYKNKWMENVDKWTNGWIDGQTQV